MYKGNPIAKRAFQSYRRSKLNNTCIASDVAGINILRVDLPAQLEDEDLGHAAQLGHAEVVEVVDDVARGQQPAVGTAQVVVVAARALVAVRRHHDEHALRARHHRAQRLQGVQRLLRQR